MAKGNAININDLPAPLVGALPFTTRDSGDRQEFPTGSVRDSRTGKGRYDLIPAYPQKRLAQLYERGAEKYADNNWQKGQPLARYMESLERHLNDFKDGDMVEDHLASIAWNAFAFMWTKREIDEGRLPAALDDWTGGPDRQKSQRAEACAKLLQEEKTK